jgi:TfoX/Sxy family transcriptional regulator of competence genes
MPYDQKLAARVREALSGRADVVEKAMFGGVTFMVAGNMCCGVHRDDLIIRLERTITLEQLASPHVRAWDFMKGPMPGMFAVNSEGCATQNALGKWIGAALEHALSLPPKDKAAPMKSRSISKKGRK